MSNQNIYTNVDQILSILQIQKNPSEYLNNQLQSLAQQNPSLYEIVQILSGQKKGNPEVLFKNIFKEYGLDYDEIINYLSKKGINK